MEKTNKNGIVKDTIQEEVSTEKLSSKGKWVIVQKADKEFIGVLKASNGQVILTSESYISEKAVLAGIETIKKNVALGNFQINTDNKGNYFYKLKDSANKLLCIGEIYSKKKSCENAVESVKKFTEKSVIIDGVIVDKTLIYYKPSENETAEEDPKYRGKWIITRDEDGMYMATLYASNGQALLNSERYKLLESVEKSIENYKKNSEANNFIIDIDKSGKYYYKLRNEQKLTIAVGNVYNDQRRCIEALESFKKFNKNAKIIPYKEHK